MRRHFDRTNEVKYTTSVSVIQSLIAIKEREVGIQPSHGRLGIEQFPAWVK